MGRPGAGGRQDGVSFATVSADPRAEVVLSLLLTDTRIDPGRVLLIAPAEGKAGDNGVVMELALQ